MKIIWVVLLSALSLHGSDDAQKKNSDPFDKFITLVTKLSHEIQKKLPVLEANDAAHTARFEELLEMLGKFEAMLHESTENGRAAATELQTKLQALERRFDQLQSTNTAAIDMLKSELAQALKKLEEKIDHPNSNATQETVASLSTQLAWYKKLTLGIIGSAGCYLIYSWLRQYKKEPTNQLSPV